MSATKRWAIAAAAVTGVAAATEYWFRRPVQTPPGTQAVPLAWAGADRLPVVGVITRLRSVITDPIGLVVRNRARYGDAFTLRVPSIYDFTFLLDGEHYRRVMSLPTDHAGVGEVLHRVPTVGYWFPREQAGPETLQELILLGRKLMAEMLPGTSVRRTPDTVPDIVKRHAVDWPRYVDLTEAIHPIVYEVTGRYFVGDELWDTFGARLTEYYRPISDGIDIPRTTLSITPFHYLMPEYRATRKLYRLIRDELPAFEASKSPLLQAIDRARLGGRPLTPADRRWMFMYVLWNAMAYPGTYTYWTLVDILTRPELAARLRSMPDPAARHELLSRCLNETVRLYPVSSLIRYLDKPYEFEHNGTTYHIPAGQAVGLFPGTMNRDPRRVPDDPDAYDPDRYLREPSPKVATFGRGAFGCVAQRFSETVTAAVLDEVLQRYSVRLPDVLPARRTRVHQTYPGSPTLAELAGR
ncbi:cytochrome P450 [Nocardia altamirensis]|uniref:cytochrome P450 n=1 Tax=Nocardia altamirensis TaxID=472158 RepID=UPI0008400207|nr:cytochrome P450 [Nocardia altamirensis]